MAIRNKTHCEICNNSNINILEYHHCIPQCDTRCTHSNSNVAILCPNCHSEVHTGEITIIGIYWSDKGYIPVYFRKGEDPPFPEELWYIKNNPLVVRPEHQEKEDD